MATLEITYDAIRRHIGRFMGATRTPDDLTTIDAQDIEDALSGGLREVYWPSGDGHIWSFLRREGTVVLVAGTREYNLPSDFTQMMTGLYYPEDSNKKPIATVSEQKHRALLGSTGDTGEVLYAVVRAESAELAALLRSKYILSFYPKPDAADTISFTYAFEPPTLDETNTKPLGGAMHSELFLESCLASAEKIMNPEGGPGIHSEKFREMLANSITRDRLITQVTEEAELWPLDGAEGSTGTLEIDREQLKRIVGNKLGHGPNPQVWNHSQDSEVEQTIRMGLRDFYWPAGGEQSGNRHFWSFLRNEGAVSVLIGKQEYDLPYDFSRLLTNFNFPEADGGQAIEVISEQEIQAMMGSSGETGTPLYCAITAKSGSGADGTRTTYQVIFYPQPTAATTLTFTYAFEPPILTAKNPMPLGGAMYSHLVLESCLAATEKVQGAEAGHSKRFQDLLAASIASDLTLTETNVGASWPKDGIAGSTGDLSINKAQLKRLVGWKNEYGPNPASWSHSQSSEVEEIVRMGLRSFYNPVVLPGERAPHNWSFMRPVVMISTSASLYAYDLPEDFAVLHGPITYTPGESVIYPPIKVTAERYVDNKLQVGEGSGRPLEAAIRIKYDDDRVAGEAQVWELILWPIPDAVYKLNVPYSINAEHLSDDTSLPLGGQPHAQTLIESCLAAAENMSGQKGVHTEKLMLCLQASIGHDREVESPDTMGVSHDHYDDSGSFSNQHGYDEHITAYNGATY